MSMKLDSPNWHGLLGGYRTPYDPRPALSKLMVHPADKDAWSELSDKLHHQGDVGTASYAAVPVILGALENVVPRPTDAYWLIGSIEEGRRNIFPRQPPFEANPVLPGWLEESYKQAWTKLFKWALNDLGDASNPESIQGLLAVIALGKDRPYLASCCFCSEEELKERFFETAEA
jgi:hypothetical protein